MPTLLADPLLAAVNAITLLVLLWDMFLAGHIAQHRDAPRPFAAVTGLIGLLVAPALIAQVVGANILTGRAVHAIAWVWPLVLVLFVVQAGYATARRLVTPFIGVPILVYDVIIAASAVIRYGESRGWGLPTVALALPAAETAVLGLLTGAAALASPFALAMPLVAPAYPARWRLSRGIRAAFAVFATAASALVLLEGVRGVRAVTSYADYDREPLRERPAADFALGLRLLPALDGPPPALALRHDLALADSTGVAVLMLEIEPAGARFAALDSLARALEGRRSDSTLLIVEMGYGPDDAEARRRDAAAYDAARLADLDRVVRRLRPDVLVPLADPYGAGARRVGRVSPREWAAYLTRASARAKRLRPRTRVAVVAGRFDAADSVLFAWAAAPGSPIDVLGFGLRPSFDGGVSLDARLHAADRWLRLAPGTKPVWVLPASGYPGAHGERSQARALWGAIAWASARERVKGVVVADAGDYAGRTGLRAPGGRLRSAAAVITRAERGLRETATR